MAKRIWIKAVEKPRPGKPTEEEKAAIVSTCGAFIREVLKPRFLPEIRPSNEFNYCVDIFGEWRAGRYRFMQRYRSDSPIRIRDEFELPFARLDFMGPDRFDIYWMRHNDQWWPVHHGVPLKEALELIVSNPVLHPL
jgi:hypothetical protein